MHNKLILVTRPKEQAQSLRVAIESLGGRVIVIPSIVIKPIVNKQSAKRIQPLSQFDMVIFVSTNAVRYGLPLMQSSCSNFPSHLKIAAIGQTTAAALQEQGIKLDVCPKELFTSESLLALPELKSVNGKRIIIFRGIGGRRLLAKTLRERGADVCSIACYRRQMPEMDTRCIQHTWKNEKIDVIVVNSITGMKNLFSLFGKKARVWLTQQTWLVLSERMRRAARQLGIITPILLSETASEKAIVNRLTKWAAHDHE